MPVRARSFYGVERCVEPGLDGPALSRHRRLFNQGRSQDFGQVRGRSDLARVLTQHQRLAARDRVLHSRQRLE